MTIVRTHGTRRRAALRVGQMRKDRARPLRLLSSSADGTPSTQHSLGLQLIDAIAHAAAAQRAAACAAARRLVRRHVSLCRRLRTAPRRRMGVVGHRERRSCTVSLARCDTDVPSLLRLLAPRAVPRIVLVGGLGNARLTSVDADAGADATDGVGPLLAKLAESLSTTTTRCSPPRRSRRSPGSWHDAQGTLRRAHAPGACRDLHARRRRGWQRRTHARHRRRLRLHVGERHRVTRRRTR